MSQSPNGEQVGRQPTELVMPGGRFLTADYLDAQQAFTRYGQDGAREQVAMQPRPSGGTNPLTYRGGRSA